jgi:hypothetical protein
MCRMAKPEALRPWVLLLHQIPATPGYLRVKIGRRLQALGAVAVKNSVYVLPRTDAALEDLQWVRREIVDAGGDASVCEARFAFGLTDEAIEALFNAARDADYRELEAEARALHATTTRTGQRRAARAPLVARLQRLRRRMGEVAAIDFFSAPRRAVIDRLLVSIEASLRPPASPRPATAAAGDVQDATWVTRRGLEVDRIASAWLIRRFIDAGARFKFVDGKGYVPRPGELRFDMFEAEYTHEGNRCTFEVLVRRFALKGAALRHIAEIVHQIDLKDDTFARAEAPGVAKLLAGIGLRNASDDARLAEGSAVFDSLYAAFLKR